MVGPGGVVAEQVLVQKYLSWPPTQMLRVRRGSYCVADCATVAEVAWLVDLAAWCRSRAGSVRWATLVARR